MHARLSGWMFMASAPMSLVGVWLASHIRDRYGDSSESVGAQILGAALLVGAVGVVPNRDVPR